MVYLDYIFFSEFYKTPRNEDSEEDTSTWD